MTFPFTPDNPTAMVRKVQEYRRRHAAILGAEDTHFGGWVEDGKTVYLDVVKIIPDRDEAVRFGIDNNQKAIFNLATFEEIEL